MRNRPEGEYLDLDSDGATLGDIDTAHALALRMAREL
ncbi:hypothetical protein [Microvirga vignae]